MSTSALTLEIRQASKAYGGLRALIDADLDLVGGEVHGLIGENGAGKSTLIKLLAALESADSLTTRLNGNPVDLKDAATAYRLGLRFIHQELNIVPALSVAENLFINNPLPRLAGIFVDRRALNQRTRAVLQQLGVSHIDPRRKAASLSSGDAMLVKIASAFIGEAHGDQPLIMIMDEPTAALNSDEVNLLFDVIGRLRARGYALLYVTHRLDELFRIAQRVTVMRDGRVINTRAIADTSTSELIHEMTGRAAQTAQSGGAATASISAGTPRLKVGVVNIADMAINHPDSGKLDVGASLGSPTVADFPPRLVSSQFTTPLKVSGLRTDAVAYASLNVGAGEILGIAGLVGSGRSELLQGLCGIDPLLAGRIELGGRRSPKLSPAKAWACGIAYVPEERRSQGLFQGDRVSHSITMPHLDRLSLLKTFLHQGKAKALSRSLGESVRLKATGVSQRVRQLSGGNQQKLLFARAILAQPRLILLDEPTRGVDVGAKYDIYRLIRELAAAGASIIMVSSEFDELIALCDRILIMRKGRTAEAVPAAGLNESQLLELCYDFG